MEEIELELVNIFTELVESADPQLLQCDMDHVFISCPPTLTVFFMRGLQRLHRFNFPREKNKQFHSWRGYTIVPSCEMEISLFHKDYALHKKQWMKSTILLMDPTTAKQKGIPVEVTTIALDGWIKLEKLWK